MQTILVTGSAGFIGKHLMEALGRREGVTALGFDVGHPPGQLERGLTEADVIFHLAGVNRPQSASEFQTGNADFTASICDSLAALGRNPTIVLSSSVQAALDNPYGLSKREAEQAVKSWVESGGQGSGQKSEGTSRNTSPRPSPQGGEGGQKSVHPRAVIFRLKNVFGKWCRPNYNSVTATFCHNIAHDLPITISDPAKELELVYIDDVIAAFLSVLDSGPSSNSLAHRMGEGQGEGAALTSGLRPLPPGSCVFREVPRSFKTTLGDLAAKIRSFRESRQTLLVTSFDDEFNHCLYATYLSYLDGPEFAYPLLQRHDNRGVLAEFVKSPTFGQIFVSRTKPGITRGNHYHHTKTEKFFVVEGDAIIRFRPIVSREQGAGSVEPPLEPRTPKPEHSTPNFQLPTSNSDIIEHRVSGRDFKVVDIPPGYAHSIENVGQTELVTLFWASEIFDPNRPDVYPASVL